VPVQNHRRFEDYLPREGFAENELTPEDFRVILNELMRLAANGPTMSSTPWSTILLTILLVLAGNSAGFRTGDAARFARIRAGARLGAAELAARLRRSHGSAPRSLRPS